MSKCAPGRKLPHTGADARTVALRRERATEYIEQGTVTHLLLIGDVWLRHDDRGVGRKRQR
jgi:hypothetical protein